MAPKFGSFALLCFLELNQALRHVNPGNMSDSDAEGGKATDSNSEEAGSQGLGFELNGRINSGSGGDGHDKILKICNAFCNGHCSWSICRNLFCPQCMPSTPPPNNKHPISTCAGNCLVTTTFERRGSEMCVRTENCPDGTAEIKPECEVMPDSMWERAIGEWNAMNTTQRACRGAFDCCIAEGRGTSRSCRGQCSNGMCSGFKC